MKGTLPLFLHLLRNGLSAWFASRTFCSLRTNRNGSYANSYAVAPLHGRLPVTKQAWSATAILWGPFSETEKCYCLSCSTVIYPHVMFSTSYFKSSLSTISIKRVPWVRDFECVRLKFSGRGAGLVTPSKPPPSYEQLLPLPTPCFKMFLERSLNDLPPPPPHFKHLSLLPPVPNHHPCPP